MGDFHPIPTTPGLISGWVGVDAHVGRAAGAVEVVRAFFRRTDHAATGSVVAQIRNAAGDNIEVTLGDNVESADATGSVTFADGDPILMRVISSDSVSMNVGGAFELLQSSGATTFLTTLTRVKRWLKITGSGNDTLLNDLIPFVSAAMESAMRRDIVQQTLTAEVHGITQGGWRSELVPKHWPVSAVSAVRENGTVLTSAQYRILGQTLIQRISGTPVSKAYWQAGFVELDYTAGYASIPEDLAGAATAEVALAFEQTKEGDGRLGLTGGVFSGQFDSQFRAWDWQPTTKYVLSRHARVV